ncbi:Uncharacterised protein [Enterobacter hormaechei]|nr:Uncharacterised protein [Enterobacter hormaechei]
MVNWQLALRVFGMREPVTRTFCFGQAVACIKQVILNGFEGFMHQLVAGSVRIVKAVLRQIVGKIGHANPQTTTCFGREFCSGHRVVLIIEQRVQRRHSIERHVFECVQRADRTQVKRR